MLPRTVLPGETSPELRTFGPGSALEEDVVLAGAEYIARAEDRGWIIDYDLLTDTYEISEFPVLPEEEPILRTEELPYELTIGEDPYGNPAVYLSYTNTTDYTVESFGLPVLAAEPNRIYEFSSDEVVPPGEVSPAFYGFDILPEWELSPTYFIVKVRSAEGSAYWVSYDFKLEHYQTMQDLYE